MPNLVEIGQTAAEIMAIFRFFQDGGRPFTREGHLVVFITVQRLVGIDAVVLIQAKFHYAILVADMVCDLAQTCSELEFGLSRTI